MPLKAEDGDDSLPSSSSTPDAASAAEASGTNTENTATSGTPQDDENANDKEVFDRKQEPIVTLVEDTEEESSHDENTNEDDDGSMNDDDDDDGMPLFKYSRLFGSLPRQRTTAKDISESKPLSVPCTTSVMGKVVLNSETTLRPSEGGGGGSSIGGSSSALPQQDSSGTNINAPAGGDVVAENLWTDLWQGEPMPIVAMGFQDGRVWLLDAVTATAIATPDQLQVRTDNRNESIVALSLDASGTQLAAIDQAGMCCIWDIKYTIQMRSPRTAVTTSSTTRMPEGGNAFSNFMSAITGGGAAAAARHDSDNQNAHSGDDETTDHDAPDRLVPTLAVASLQVQRVSYPKSFGKPTCLALDPAYRRRREKAMMVGFLDGRLVQTKRGLFFQRRNDAVIYQAISDDDKYFLGIEAIAWRGTLIAWADCSGVRLMDSDSLKRVAHIDRPTGARPSLYPTVSDMRPTLCFETSSRLLIAWGDCLLNLNVRESSVGRQTSDVGVSTGTSSETQATGSGNGSVNVRRRTVECSMAWELDCVACGVAPLDAHHVLVLGLLPPLDEDGGQASDVDQTNDIELQVISRSNGDIVYSDLLPLLRATPKGRTRKRTPESVSAYNLLSSFALPRMDDAFELQIENLDYDDMEGPSTYMFSTPEARRTFRDPHLKWDLSMISFADEDRTHEKVNKREESSAEDFDEVSSEDSDDYDFIFRPLPRQDNQNGAGKLTAPPLVLIVSSSDTVLTRVRDIDDAVSYSLSEKKAALALRRGLCHLRQLRRYRIQELVGEYFRALLRLPENSEDVKIMSSRHLSLRRMRLAAEAMPILLGGEVSMWQTWLSELEKIPGALFVARVFLPVRDPILPKEVYSRVLETMLLQVEEMARESTDNEAVNRLKVEAEGHFLNTLIAWGSSSILKEYIKLYQSQSSRDSRFAGTVRALEEGLVRRREQTSAMYLNFPVIRPSSTSDETVASPSNVHTLDNRRDSLFDVSEVHTFVSRRLSPESPPESDAAGANVNSRVALDAIAKLNMMKGNFDDALRWYLTIGARHSIKPLEELEDDAISAVVRDDVKRTRKKGRESTYAHVLSIIESHHLHQCLLDKEFLQEDLDSPPLFALLRLVGLELLGDFLVEHCIAPQKSEASTSAIVARPSVDTGMPSDKTDGERRGTLPLDLVAEQLDGSPKLLHWYLHLVFTRKPEAYVKFPNTANPPPIITRLHRKHIDLYIKYAGEYRDSSKVLEGIEAYRVTEKTTPLLSFLRVVLQLGGIRNIEVAKKLEVERRGAGVSRTFGLELDMLEIKKKLGGGERRGAMAGVSRTFALELAYLLEHFGDGSEDEARLILELYLKGTMNLMLAVSYAQRAGQHSSALWEILINYCLSGKSAASSSNTSIDGSLFGSLLEAAALSGADLAHLVSQIPPGMAIEGLRPRLVAAVADYRLKLQMNESASEIAGSDKVALLREQGLRSRRGARVETANEPVLSGAQAESKVDETKAKHLPRTLRTSERQDRCKLAYSLPMR